MKFVTTVQSFCEILHFNSLNLRKACVKYHVCKILYLIKHWVAQQRVLIEWKKYQMFDWIIVGSRRVFRGWFIQDLKQGWGDQVL